MRVMSALDLALQRSAPLLAHSVAYLFWQSSMHSEREGILKVLKKYSQLNGREYLISNKYSPSEPF